MLQSRVYRPFQAVRAPHHMAIRLPHRTVTCMAAAKGFGAAKPAATPETCTCGSKVVYKDCCQPFHEGKATPGTPEAALRARFSAFAKGEVEYLLSTDKRESNSPDQLKRDITSSCNNLTYSGLKVIEIEDAGASGQTIKFSYKSQPQAKQTKTPIRVGRSPMAKGDSIERNLDGSVRVYTNTEKSKFVQDAGIWVLKESEMIESS